MGGRTVVFVIGTQMACIFNTVSLGLTAGMTDSFEGGLFEEGGGLLEDLRYIYLGKPNSGTYVRETGTQEKMTHQPKRKGRETRQPLAQRVSHFHKLFDFTN